MSEKHDECCMESGDLSGGATVSAADVPDEARVEEERLQKEYADIEDAGPEAEPDSNTENVEEE